MLALKDKNHTKTAQTSSVESVADEIIKYKQLLDEGIITEEEFSARRYEQDMKKLEAPPACISAD